VSILRELGYNTNTLHAQTLLMQEPHTWYAALWNTKTERLLTRNVVIPASEHKDITGGNSAQIVRFAEKNAAKQRRMLGRVRDVTKR
jgi:hypothetical protein